MSAALLEEIVAFWREAGPDRWFTADPGFDALCRERFLACYEAAARGDFNDWEVEPEGALAVILLLDQFPRNLFRGTRRAFATDPTALAAAERAVERRFDQAIDPELRRFVYMPFMHSEELADQERSVALFEALGDEESLRYAHIHRDLIARFGRFPHRNVILGRGSTPEEVAYLEGEGAFMG